MVYGDFVAPVRSAISLAFTDFFLSFTPPRLLEHRLKGRVSIPRSAYGVHGCPVQSKAISPPGCDRFVTGQGLQPVVLGTRFKRPPPPFFSGWWSTYPVLGICSSDDAYTTRNRPEDLGGAT